MLTGQTSRVERTHALIRLDDFAYKIAPIMTKSGMVYQPIDYVSHVTVTGNDGIPKHLTVRVNHPIDVDGTLYYQASYGFGMQFLVTREGRRDAALSERTLLEGDSFDLPGTQRNVLYERFAPTVDKQSGVPTADPRVNNPAVVLAASQAGNALGEALVPLGSSIDLGDGWRATPKRYVLYSGFQYRNDPGVPLVGIGAFVLLAGLVISFYFLPARLYVRVDEAASAPLPRRRGRDDGQGVRRFLKRICAASCDVTPGNRPPSRRTIGAMQLPLDEFLIAVALAAYTVGALALLLYFFSRQAWLRNVGAPLAILGCVAQFAQLIARFELTHVWPLLNLYGSLSLFAAMSVAIYIGFAFRYRLWFAGGFVLALAAIFLAYGVTWYEGTMPPVPSLQSYWAKIHVPIVVSSYAAFLVAFVFSCIYLMKYYAERSTIAATRSIAARSRDGSPRLPSLPQLDVIVYRAVAIGLPLISIGIITGAMWAKEAWGAYWQWDPKETAALFSWIIYLAYMHLHTRHAWRGLRTNWVSVIGFLSIIFCYLGVNIWISGLHSYKVSDARRIRVVLAAD